MRGGLFVIVVSWTGFVQTKNRVLILRKKKEVCKGMRDDLKYKQKPSF